MYDQPKVLPAGDQAVSVEFGDEISVEVNTRVLALERLIQQNAIGGVRETVPSFRALLVYYDPLVIGWEDVVTSLSSLLAEARAETLPPNRLVELPCCYGGELGADLDEAASRLGLSPDELIRLHATAEYLVYFIGFTPGMPYLRSLGQPLTIPRLTTPRTKTRRPIGNEPSEWRFRAVCVGRGEVYRVHTDPADCPALRESAPATSPPSKVLRHRERQGPA